MVPVGWHVCHTCVVRHMNRGGCSPVAVRGGAGGGRRGEACRRPGSASAAWTALHGSASERRFAAWGAGPAGGGAPYLVHIGHDRAPRHYRLPTPRPGVARRV